MRFRKKSKPVENPEPVENLEPAKPFSERKLVRALDDNREKAKDFLKDDDKVEGLLRDFERKLKHIPKIGGWASDIAVMLSMIRAYVMKRYRDVPVASIIIAIAAVIYVVNPLDLVPDVLPLIGYVDDAAAIGFVLDSIHKDLKKYKEWQKENGMR